MANVCKIVETSTEYATLKAAVEALQDNQTIQLIANHDITEDVTIQNTCTIDLNGKTMTATLGDNPGRFTVGAGTTTLKDVVGGGIFKVAAGQTSTTNALITLASEATLIIDGAELYSDSKDENPSYGFLCTVFVADNSKLEMKSGKATGGYYTFSTNGLLSTGTSIKVSGGEVISDRDFAIYAPDKTGSVEVTGGTITGGCGAIMSNGSNVTISGGTLKSTGTGDSGAWTGGDGTAGTPNSTVAIFGRYATPTATISDGTLIAEGDANCIQLADFAEATVNVTGGTFQATGETSEIFGETTLADEPKTSTVEVESGSFNKTFDEKYLAPDTELVENEDGTFGPAPVDPDPEEPDDPDKPGGDDDKPEEVDLSKKASSYDILVYNSITMPPYNYNDKDWRRDV